MDADDYSYSDDEEQSDYELDIDMDDESNAPSTTSSDQQIKVIKSAELTNEMNQMVERTAAVLGCVPPDTAKVLLNFFAWDPEKLFEKFYEAESPEVFLKKHKIDIPKKQGNDPALKKGICMICFDRKTTLFGLSCGHLFCKDCWDSYLSTRFRSEGDPYAACPSPDCYQYLNEELVEKLLKKQTEKAFFQRLLIQSFVNTNPLLQWCPHEKCDSVVKVKSAETAPVTCECGTTFCFLCSQEWHEPLSCELLKKWVKKYSGDSESMKWVSVNTKDCPKCKSAIEKNGGCNHMVCRKKGCNYEFCWLCMEDWKVHGYNNQGGCNKFKENVATDQANKFREQLRRYMHYYDRFANHRKSLQAETQLLIIISTKIEQMQGQGLSWIETQFLRDAVRVLNQCRQTLMFAYAFAYYLPSSNNKSIFEDNQNDLEHATEELSGLLERDIDLEKDDLSKLKQKVQDRYRYVDQRRLKMSQHCAEGVEKGFWVFQNDE